VVRNRFRRRVREYFRVTMRQRFQHATSLVVIARAGAGQLSGASLRAELDAAAAALSGKVSS
jgi:ribonuclease P protein component